MRFAGKTVAIVGPAPHIAELEQADHINSFDVVVRVNNALPIPDAIKRTTGDRCDVLYVRRKRNGMSEAWHSLKEIRVKTNVLWNSDVDLRDYKPFKEKIKIVDPEHYYALKRKLGCVPNTGFMAIADILAEQPAKLYITGFTFYQTGGYAAAYDVPASQHRRAAERKGDGPTHRQEPQLAYFRQQFYHLPNIEVDKVLQEVLQ